MHRTTRKSAAFRAYTSGGARSVIDKVDDNTLMQETNDARRLRF
jgi:hypothetical protein